MSTLIIGTKCSNGIVLAADRRELRGHEPSECSKIRRIDIKVGRKEACVLLAGAGIAAFWDEIAWSLPGLIRPKPGSGPLRLLDVVDVVSSLSINLSARYQREGLDERLGCVIVGLERLCSGAAQMYYFAGAGFSKADFICLGSGDKYALPMADMMLRGRGLAAEEAVQAMPFLFLLVERVNVSVGGGPDVWVLRDEIQAMQESGSAIDKIKSRISTLAVEDPYGLLSSLADRGPAAKRSQRQA